jgi:hypothetical protein
MRFWMCCLAFAQASAVGSWTAQARADETNQRCAAAHEGAQVNKRDGKYLTALEYAKQCTQSECHPILVNDCVKFYDEIHRDIPTFVFSAEDGDGAELLDVRVLVDGKLLLEKLDGNPRALDPGAHTFRFEKQGLPPVEVTQTARVGDKNRLIEVTLGKKKSLETTTYSPELDQKRGVPTGTFILGGVAVVGLGAFAALRVSGILDYNALNGTCSPRCSAEEVDDIRTKFQLSFVALGVSAAALAGATIIFFTSRNESETLVAEVGAVPLERGGGARFTARF